MHLCSTVVVVVVVHVTRADTGFLPTLPLFLDDVKLGVYYDNTLYQIDNLIQRLLATDNKKFMIQAFTLKEDQKKARRRQEEDRTGGVPQRGCVFRAKE